jgi:hypothetical protein
VFLSVRDLNFLVYSKFDCIDFTPLVLWSLSINLDVDVITSITSTVALFKIALLHEATKGLLLNHDCIDFTPLVLWSLSINLDVDVITSITATVTLFKIASLHEATKGLLLNHNTVGSL